MTITCWRTLALDLRVIEWRKLANGQITPMRLKSMKLCGGLAAGSMAAREVPMRRLSHFVAWIAFGVGAGMTYSAWQNSFGGEETVILGFIIMLMAALAVFATLIL